MPKILAGYELNFAKLSATWAEHRPAYFVATNRKVNASSSISQHQATVVSETACLRLITRQRDSWAGSKAYGIILY